jgi:hypothetical protein
MKSRTKAGRTLRETGSETLKDDECNHYPCYCDEGNFL